LSAALASEGLATTLSFGALFHPWPIVRETSGALHDAIWPVSPEGAIAGAIADRTLHSGAWYSVGNQILQGVVSLAPVLGDRAVAMLLAAGINPIAQQPRGFAALASQTPTDLPELGELHVRRLLILLRRLAVREGSDLVFQTNDDALRRLAERKFNALLGRLYVRGAFAGGTHQQAYRVVADASVNQSSGVDLGRFIVELRVAPSRPLAFLTIRLVQRGGELLTAQET
jgi:phage tail sheath protein FI